MPNAENKVQFNLKNTHYAVLDESGGNPKWSAPVFVPGAVSLSLNAEGDVTPFYADGITYYQCVSNNGYKGDLEMARLIDQMRKDIWKIEERDTDHVLLENSNIEPAPFALLFQIDGDADNELYCLYNCSATRPSIEGETTNDSKTPKTQKANISAVPLESGYVMARTTANTPAAVRETWFKQVYQPTSASSEG